LEHKNDFGYKMSEKEVNLSSIDEDETIYNDVSSLEESIHDIGSEMNGIKHKSSVLPSESMNEMSSKDHSCLLSTHSNSGCSASNVLVHRKVDFDCNMSEKDVNLSSIDDESIYNDVSSLEESFIDSDSELFERRMKHNSVLPSESVDEMSSSGLSCQLSSHSNSSSSSSASNVLVHEKRTSHLQMKHF